jgi:hypothetical protein
MRSEIKPARLGVAILAVLAAASLVGCGNAGNSTNATDAFATSFNASFDKSVHDSCVTSAQSHGSVTPDVAEKYCSCLVGQFSKLTVQQKMALQPTSPEMQQAEAACVPQSPATNAP